MSRITSLSLALLVLGASPCAADDPTRPQAQAHAASAPGQLEASKLPHFGISRRFPVGGDGGWDYLVFDGSSNRLFVSRSTHVMVLDPDSGKVIGDIPGTEGVHGVALALDLKRGFTSNGRSSTVSIFDLATLGVSSKVKTTGENPDAILYEPVTKRVFTFNGRGRNATVIDAAAGTVVGTVPLGGKPETACLGRQRKGLRQHRGQERGRGHRPEDADRRDPLAPAGMRRADRPGDRRETAAALRRMPQPAAVRPEQRGRERRLEGPDGRGQRCRLLRGRDRAGLRLERRRDPGGHPGDVTRQLRGRADRLDREGGSDPRSRSEDASDLPFERPVRAAAVAHGRPSEPPTGHDPGFLRDPRRRPGTLTGSGVKSCISGTHALPANSLVSVWTLTRSPSLMKSGTRISRPVSSVAGLVAPPLEVSPRKPGSV